MKSNGHNDPIDEDAPQEDQEPSLDALRDLLIGPTQGEVRDLQAQYLAVLKQHAALYQRVERLATTWGEDPEQLRTRVADTLAEAVLLRQSTDRKDERTVKLATAVRPIVEQTLLESAARNPKTLSDSLFPVMMPAIRKAIGHMLERLIQQINRALEQRLSVQSLKWRLEAYRTGTSYAEIVLAHTLDYRVEQVFLIHRETGLLLLHVAGESEERDADMISGMLTAIQDFTQDSFHTDREEGLDTLQVGDLKVWLERSPYAVLAAVIRGVPPAAFHVKMQETLENVHRFHATDLQTFDGDNAPFEVARPLLEQCLETRYKNESKEEAERLKKIRRRRRRFFYFILLLLIGTALFFWIRNTIRWNDYMTHLQDEPGLVITQSGRYWLEGLRDPLAADPDTFLNCEPTSYWCSCHIDPTDVESTWEPYIAPVPELTLKRAQTLLKPPDGTTLRIEQETLSITGTAPVEWLVDALKLAPALPGISTVELADQGPSISELTESIQATRLTFAQGASGLDGNQDEIIEALIRNMHLLHREATLAGQQVHIEIIGHASSEGSPAANEQLSMARAEAVRTTLLEHGLQALPARPDGIILSTGSDPASTQEITEAEREANRRVAFRVRVE